MLSVTAQYALRALSELAAAPPAQSVRGRELATRCAIPANYLSKLLVTLGDAGLIRATRGTGGGYRLARPAHSIRVAEVVELFDGGVANPPCLLGIRKLCSDENPCCAHASWRSAKQAYFEFLQNTTVSDIAADGAAPRRRARRATI
jgi:Rrf2 family iron-sulfur cluster assembly transcriptional regulator